MHQETITIIFEWLNESSKDNDHPMVFWLFGNDRSETSAVAQSVALRAHAENRLASSFFFPWSSSQKGRDPADLVPTVMYKLAQYDPDILRTVVNSIIANPDVRDEKARMQIYLLSKIPFINMDSLTSLNLSLLIVIDALDTCNDLDDPLTVAAIGEFIQTLCTQPLRIKVLVTSRFPRAIRQIVCGQAFPPYRQLALPYIIATDRLSYAPIPCPSDDGKGAPYSHPCEHGMILIWLRIVEFSQTGNVCAMGLASITFRLPRRNSGRHREHHAYLVYAADRSLHCLLACGPCWNRQVGDCKNFMQGIRLGTHH